jgi:hypothetical protein
VYVGSYDHFVYAFGASQESTGDIPQLVLLLAFSLIILLIVVLVIVLYRRKRGA